MSHLQKSVLFQAWVPNDTDSSLTSKAPVNPETDKR